MKIKRILEELTNIENQLNSNQIEDAKSDLNLLMHELEEEELGNDVAKALGHMNKNGTYITGDKLIDNEILSENDSWK
jgi:hypothetical protein